MRLKFFVISFLALGGVYGLSYIFPAVLFLYVIIIPAFLLGIYDFFQKGHTILRNFPVIGHFRYWLELIRPEIQQYFIERYEDGTPFSREQRSVIYQRAKRQLDTVPFGTQRNLYAPGHEWINHSMMPTQLLPQEARIRIGNEQCSQPYDSSLLNVSGMSFGALSNRAILALNKGARDGGFSHNTGEGGISPYHRENGGDLVWQIGTGYFGCRTKSGGFCPDKFREKSQIDQIKMIELKLSQGAKPGHGGILPGAKVNEEIANTREVPIGKDVISPPYHSTFSTPRGLIEFLAKLRELSGGKPVGFKVCIGKRREFFSVCKAMNETQIYPDFIVIDGAEGGTGAAPLEFANSIGTPLHDGLIFAHNALVGTNLRDKVRLIAGGKVTTGFHIATKLALGADLCTSARAMMFAIGCIQALRCNSNDCPTGIATQDQRLIRGLDVDDKAKRVANYHKLTIHSFLEVLSAAGLSHPSELRPWHIHRRVGFSLVKHYGEIYDYLSPGALLDGDVPQSFYHAWKNSSAENF